MRRIGDRDRSWVRDLTTEYWGAETVVAHGLVYRPDQLEGWIAEHVEGDRQGLLTFTVDDHQLEIVTLNSLVPGRGIGRRLMAEALCHARELACSRVWLITTNDNLRAIDFYLRQGFRLVAVHLDALDVSRRLKPTIPRIGEHGLELRDELEFSLQLEPGEVEDGGAAKR